MMQNPPLNNKPSTILQEIDLVTLHPDVVNGHIEMLDATRESITKVLQDFLVVKELSDDRISVIDGFFSSSMSTDLTNGTC